MDKHIFSGMTWEPTNTNATRSALDNLQDHLISGTGISIQERWLLYIEMASDKTPPTPLNFHWWLIHTNIVYITLSQ